MVFHSHTHQHAGDASHDHGHAPGLTDLIGSPAVPDPGESDVDRQPPWSSAPSLSHDVYRGVHSHAHQSHGENDGDGDGLHSHSHSHMGDNMHGHSHDMVTQAAQAGGVSSSGRGPVDTSPAGRQRFMRNSAFTGRQPERYVPDDGVPGFIANLCRAEEALMEAERTGDWTAIKIAQTRFDACLRVYDREANTSISGPETSRQSRRMRAEAEQRIAFERGGDDWLGLSAADRNRSV